MGGESSMGPLVPTVKSEPPPPLEPPPALPAPPQEEEEAGGSELDKDFLCPICMQIIKDAFLTACGHSFCYMCIATHLQNKSDCPCCGHYLTPNHLFPNFLLNKLLKKTYASQIARHGTPFEQLRQALQEARWNPSLGFKRRRSNQILVQKNGQDTGLIFYNL